MQYKHIQLYDTQDVAELYIRFIDTERAGLRRSRPGGEETRGGAAPLRLPGMALNCRAWFILLNRPDNHDGLPAWLSIAVPGLFS